MKRKTKTSGEGRLSAADTPPALATVLAALEINGALSETRLRDLRSAVKRVAELLGNVPAAIPLVMEKVPGGTRRRQPHRRWHDAEALH